MEHDAARQVSYIQQALSQNKRPTGFFIGAGCPLAIRNPDHTPLIPDVAGLTQKIADTFATAPNKADWETLIKAVVEDGGDIGNIEHILSNIRQLAAVAGKSSVRGLTRAALDKLDATICGVISKLVDKALPDLGSPYHNLAIWIRSIRRVLPVQVFTTNYDLLMEQALEESATPYFDGFVGSRQAFFDLGAVEDENILPARWARLWKIHGSLNWRLTADGKRVVRSDNQDKTASYLIYPSHLKYDQSRKMPYLAMLDRLKIFLLQPNATLFMSGYSFSDEHINDIIRSALEANPTAQAFALMYGDLDVEKYKKARECGCLLPNLTVIGDHSAIIGRNHGPWKDVPDGLSSSTTPGAITTDADGKVTVGMGDFASFGTLLRHLTGDETEVVAGA